MSLWNSGDVKTRASSEEFRTFGIRNGVQPSVGKTGSAMTTRLQTLSSPLSKKSLFTCARGRRWFGCVPRLSRILRPTIIVSGVIPRWTRYSLRCAWQHGHVRIDPDPDRPESALLGQYLDYRRETMLSKSGGLTQEQLALTGCRRRDWVGPAVGAAASHRPALFTTMGDPGPHRGNRTPRWPRRIPP